MGATRAHITLPDELIAEIDSVVGPRGRSAFLVETAKAELRRRRLLAFLADPEPAWKDEDHPELARLGTAEYVHRMRRYVSPRQKRIARKLTETE
jgi:hypothetical protein